VTFSPYLFEEQMVEHEALQYTLSPSGLPAGYWGQCASWGAK